jgi:hypothetical protein
VKIEWLQRNQDPSSKKVTLFIVVVNNLDLEEETCNPKTGRKGQVGRTRFKRTKTKAPSQKRVKFKETSNDLDVAFPVPLFSASNELPQNSNKVQLNEEQNQHHTTQTTQAESDVVVVQKNVLSLKIDKNPNDQPSKSSSLLQSLLKSFKSWM